MCNQRINIMIQRHVSSAKLIDRVGKGRNDRVPRDFSPRRVRACDREFANGTRLSTPPSFPPRSRSEGAIVAGKSRRRSSSLSLPLSYFSMCASRVGRWQCTGGLAPDTPYAVTLSQPRGILLCTSVRVTRAPSSPLLSSSPLASN